MLVCVGVCAESVCGCVVLCFGAGVLCCVVMCGVGAGVGVQCVVCGVCGVCAWCVCVVCVVCVARLGTRKNPVCTFKNASVCTGKTRAC